MIHCRAYPVWQWLSVSDAGLQDLTPIRALGLSRGQLGHNDTSQLSEILVSDALGARRGPFRPGLAKGLKLVATPGGRGRVHCHSCMGWDRTDHCVPERNIPKHRITC